MDGGRTVRFERLLPGRFAERVNVFSIGVLTPYLNFHRPCLFPEEVVDAKGKRRKRYPYANLMTPYEKLKSLPEADQYLKPGITFKQLDAIAYAISDNEAARRLNQARTELFQHINRAQKPAARTGSLRTSLQAHLWIGKDLVDGASA